MRGRDRQKYYAPRLLITLDSPEEEHREEKGVKSTWLRASDRKRSDEDCVEYGFCERNAHFEKLKQGKE